MRQVVMLFIVAIAIIESCKEDKNDCLHGCGNKPPRDTIYSTKEFVPYWYFNKGSYWVYKRTDTIPNIYDTATVVTTIKRINFDPSSNSVSALEERIIRIIHSDSGFWDRYTTNTKSFFIKSSINNPTIILWHWASDRIVFIGDYHYSSNQMLWGKYKAMAELTINSGTYTLPNTITYIDTSSGVQVFLSKNVGISKIIIKQETWELVNYHLEP